MSRSSGLAGLPSALTTSGETSAGRNGLTVAPDAAMPATTTPSARIGMPPAPGNTASGDACAKPAATGGAIVVIRCRCSVLGICWVAEIHALERARAMPPGPPWSIREAVTSRPLAPTTAMPPRSPSCSALSIARWTRARASRRARSRGCSSVTAVRLPPCCSHRPRSCSHRSCGWRRRWPGRVRYQPVRPVRESGPSA